MELFPGGGAAVVALLVMRLSGLILVAPILSAQVVPVRIKTAVLLALTLLLWPAAAAHHIPGVTIDPATVLQEALVGLVLGMGAAIFVSAAELAGDMLAIQMGLSGANLVNPLSETQMPVLGQLMGLTVLAFLVSLGGHVLILQSLSLSLEVLPLGTPLPVEGGVAAVVEVGSILFLLGLRFAAPVVGAMMIGNAALGVMARTVPQLNVLMMAFPLQIAVGLFTLAISLPFVATFFSQWPDAHAEVVDGLLRGLVPAAGY